MYRIVYLFIFFLISHNSYAQSVGIGNNNPHTSAVMDIRSNTKGLLIPRVSLTSDTDITTISSPLTSLLIYNLNNTLPDGEGYYYWNGNKWVRLVVKGILDNYTWTMSGNSGSNPDINFIGTTDNKPIVFRTNNIISGKIDPVRRIVNLGQSAGRAQISGLNNVYIGHESGLADTSGSSNVFIGHWAGQENLSGSENVFVGQEAGAANSTGERSTFIGEDAGVNNKRGTDNVFIGNGAGRGNKNGINNIMIGSAADVLDSNLTNAIAIGYLAEVETSNTVVIGNNNTEKWLFGRSSTILPFAALQVGTNSFNGNGAFLSTGGVWVDVSDSTKKEDITELNREELLQKISRLNIQRWKYKGTTEYHIGAMAQQFYPLFNVGADDKSIAALDLSGIALAAIQELINENQKLKNELAEIRSIVSRKK